MKVAVLIPCYNENLTIGKVVSDFLIALPEAEIYVYDNNSNDGSDLIAREAGAIVRYEYRQGKGNVIRTMFREIDADCYLMIDGDDTYPSEYAREMVSFVLNQKVDMVIGDRLTLNYFTENKRKFHGIGNTLVRKIVNYLFKGNITDIMTGYRAFSRRFVKSFPVLSQGFEIETEMTIHALDKNLHIKSVAVKYRDRPKESISKLNTYTDGFKVIKTIFKLYKDYKPFSFFGLFATLLFTISFIFFLPIWIEYLDTGLVRRIPTLISCGIILIISLQSFTCGLILDTECQKSRQNFELQMNIQEMIQSKCPNK
ncbi:MAG: glycosyltransferase family 2 protein [Clostridiaceae bacterium]